MSIESRLQISVPCLLYGADPIVIMPSADARYLEDFKNFFPVPIVVFESAKRILHASEGVPLAMDECFAPPTCPCVLVPVSIDGYCELKDLSTEWAKTEIGSFDALLLDSDGSSIAHIAVRALGILLNKSLEANRVLAQSASSLHDQITTLRTDAERSAMVGSHMIPGTTKNSIVTVFSCEPSDEALEPPTSDEVPLEILLPMKLSGLVQLDLHFQAAQESVGAVCVRVVGAEDEYVLGTWRIPYEKARGWISLAFPVPLSHLSFFATLRIIFETQLGQVPRLSLSRQYIAPAGTSTVDSLSDIARLPAIRVYSGLRGPTSTPLYWVSP